MKLKWKSLYYKFEAQENDVYWTLMQTYSENVLTNINIDPVTVDSTRGFVQRIVFEEIL